MASQAIKEYNDFAGQDGYLIVDGLDDQTPGGKKLLSDLSGSNVPNYPTEVATSDTKRYHLKVYNQAGNLQVSWDDEVEYGVANNGGLARASGGNTISFSIDTGDANDGNVLTYNGTSKKVEWSEPAGGGGNPYTKVSVTPGTSYANGKTSDYGWNLFDQDVNIANNTYSVLSTEIGYDSSKEFPDSKAIDVFKIKMPANTDFPMAVVEFQLKTGENASVNKVEVYVGETKLTQVKDAPYRDDAIVGKSIEYDNEIVHHTEYGNNYWTLGGIWNRNLASAYTGIVNSSFDHIYVKVQVHIFGSCFRVMTSHQGDIPPAS